MSASKPAMPVSAIRTGIDSRVPKAANWPSVRENRELAGKYRKRAVIKLPSGATIPKKSK